MFCAVLALSLAALAAPAKAAYENPRLYGDPLWEPDHVRIEESLGRLQPRYQGRLWGPRKVREEVSIDLEAGVVTVQRRYGNVLVGPEWVEDVTTASKAAAWHASRDEWVTQLKQEILRADRSRDDIVSIELPVQFPESIANVIGQGARLNLTGSERITFSGTSNIIEGGPTFESGNPSAFPDLDMKQQLRVNLDGTIGDKIHVLVNHDSEVDTDFDNKIRLRYDGEEDEVIQKIEMGNTDLVLPGSEFLSFRKSQQGLFGAKAEAQLGALDLTMIASKQEGETASQKFVGRAQSDSVIIRDIDYVKRKYYWVADPDTIAFYSAGGVEFVDFELFIDDRDPRTDIADGAELGFAYTDFATGAVTDTVGAQRGSFHRLIVNEDYSFNPDTGALTLDRTLQREHILAASYSFQRSDTTIVVGDLSNPDSLGLQLIAPAERDLYDDAKGFAPLRELELKNIYFLGAQNVRPETFEMRIFKEETTSGDQNEEVQESDQFDNLEFVRIFGLDYKGLTDAEPDLLVEPEFIDFEEGTVTFPNPTPFAPDSSTFNVISTGGQTGRSGDPVPLLEYNEVIYEQEPDEVIRNNSTKYFLEVKYTTPTPTYSLNRFNILEGSERVVLNGQTLTRGVDYDIDYDFGILTFRNPDASVGDAEIEVDFEFVPLFGQAKESLVGVSGTYNFGPQSYLSSSWLFFTRATPEERPKLGQEPSRILVGNMYGQWITNPRFMTNLVNALPLVKTENESEFQLQGEVALSVPNPNTKNQIYVDDMEGVEDSRELSITRGVWSPASEPVGPASLGLDRSGQVALPFNWYNPENIVRRQEVFTELADEREGQDFIQVLQFGVRDEQDPNTSDPDSTGWMGVMRNLSTTGEDFSEKKFLEIWVNDFGAAQGNLVFDMGEISEDFYTRPPADSVSFKGRGFLDTEDFDPYDGDLTVSREDWGLDNVQGDDDLGVPGDDGNDDFEFRRSTGDFSKINNYEGNSLLDTEDLDGDNFLDEDNAYLSYVIDLADTTIGAGALVQKNFDPVERPDNHWRLYRLPLDDGIPVGGVPRLRSVKYARLWADGLTDSAGVKLQVASVKIVGSAWLEENITTNDTVEPIPDSEPGGAFRVNVVNNKEDSFYFSPFDAGEDINNEARREQALVLDYVDIPSDEVGGGADSVDTGRQGAAYKQILDTGQGRSQDFTQYESLSLFFRDGRAAQGGGLREGFSEPSSGSMFFRFGPDTTNFYEFSTARLTAGEDAAWREVFIELQPLTELKLDPPQKMVTVEGREVEYRSTVVDGDTLAVYGAPTLARVRRLTLGVRGDDPSRPTVSGEIWVNEIRLRSVMKDTGYASRLTGNARFADLLTASGGMRKLDSEFRRIEGDRHGTNEFSWNVRGDVKLNKFFDGLGVSLPVTGDYSYSETTPRLAPNSDIELVDEKDKIEARSTTRRQGISSRFAKTRPSRNPFLRYTVDNLSVNGSRQKTRSRTPFLVSEDENITGAANYNLSPGQNRTFRLYRFDFSYFPTVQMGVNGRQNFRESADLREDSTGTRFEEERDPVRTRSLEGSLGVQWDPVRSNTFDTQFSFNKRQDGDLNQERGRGESVKPGSRELRRDHKSRVSWRPGVVRWLRPVLSYDTNYVEDQSSSVQTGNTDEPRLRRVENTNTREISTSISPRQIFRESVNTRSSRGRAVRGNNRARDEQIRNKGNSRGDAAQPRGEDTGGEGEDAADPEAGEEPEESGRPGIADLWSGFKRFARSFGDLRYTYRDNRSSRFSRVGDRPSLQYQFGFEDFDRGLQIPGSNLIEDNTSATFSNRFDTSWNPTQTFYIDTAYSRSITRSVRNNSRSKTVDVTWPDLSLNVDGLEKWRLLKRWAKTSSVNGSFRRQTTRSGRLPALDNPDPPGVDWFDDQTVRKDFSPLFSWNTNWNSGVNTTLSYNRTESTDESEFNDITSRTETTNQALRLTGRYSFSAPQGITLLGKKLRFRSDLTLSFDFERGEDKTREIRVDPTGNTTPTTRLHRQNLRISPRATYNFSRKVQGSLDIGYGKTKDLQRDRNETTISVAVEALIKF